MKVLVACEESQRVCNAFRKLGHEAYSCDIIECSGGYPEWHILGDALNVINGNCDFTTQDGEKHTIIGKWDLLIAHPPCTYLTNASKEFFMKFINADCDRICVENPVPLKIVNLPPYTQIIQPWQFGHPYSKRTCLWLKGLPKLEPTNIITEGVQPYVNGGCKDAYGNYRRFQGR